MPFLRLQSLECHQTETITGPDKAYLRVNGRTVWGPQKINDHESKDLGGVDRIEFAENCRIDLYDKDTRLPGDPDDHLGTAYVWSRQVGEGEQHLPFSGSRWSYTLHLRVEE